MSNSEFTKYMIAQGMKQLLEEKAFEAISVGDVAKHCHISRNTFYYHFKDKFDIINWIFYSEITPIIGDSTKINNWSENLLSLCKYMQKNKDFYIKVLQVQGQNSFSECLLEFYVNLTQNLLFNAKGDQFLTPQQIRILSRFYAFGLTGVILNWAKAGMDADPEPAIQMLEKLLSGEIFDNLLSLQQPDDLTTPYTEQSFFENK